MLAPARGESAPRVGSKPTGDQPAVPMAQILTMPCGTYQRQDEDFSCKNAAIAAAVIVDQLTLWVFAYRNTASSTIVLFFKLRRVESRSIMSRAAVEILKLAATQAGS